MRVYLVSVRGVWFDKQQAASKTTKYAAKVEVFCHVRSESKPKRL